MKTWTLIGMTVGIGFLMLMMGSGLLVGCNHQRGEDSCFGHRFGRFGPPHPLGNGKVAEKILAHMDRKAAALDLSPEQEKAYQSLREKTRARLEEAGKRRKASFEIFREEITRENPDPDRIADLMRGKMTAIHQFMEEQMDLFLAFYKVLDAGQKQKVLEEVRSKVNKCG